MKKVNLAPLSEIDGFIGACLVDSDSGLVLGSVGRGFDLDTAAAGNTEVVRAKRRTMSALRLKDRIEDMLITLGEQFHIIRPLESNDAIFIYLVLDKKRGNLGMARATTKRFEENIDLAA